MTATPEEIAAGSGFILAGDRRNNWSFIRQRNGSVRDLFNKVRRTQPSSEGRLLTTAEYVDVVAFLLQLNGFPGGRVPLRNHENEMRGVMLNEPGFERLFNGRDFTGIGFVLGGNCTAPPSGCARTEPGSTFTVRDGVLVNSGTPHGYWHPERQFLNFTLRFDFRYPAPPEMDSDEQFQGNSGTLLFIQRHQVWPRNLEIQGSFNGIGGITPIDTRAVSKTDADARRRAMRPLGAWNSMEIVSKDGQVTAALNGVLISTVTEHEFREPGFIGFQAEGTEIHWRHIRIRLE